MREGLIRIDAPSVRRICHRLECQRLAVWQEIKRIGYRKAPAFWQWCDEHVERGQGSR